MQQLKIALYIEGSTDENFLESVVYRTSVRILDAYREWNGNLARPIVIPKDGTLATQKERILRAACDAVHYDILVIHADADDSTMTRALEDRFLPGYNLVQQSREQVCKLLVPVIPIYMTEAWMLVDHKALREAIGTDLEPWQLGLTNHASQVESIADPKQTLRKVVERAYASRTRRRRKVELGELYPFLGAKVDLCQLDKLNAYRLFTEKLSDAFRQLNLIPDGYDY